MTHDELLEKIDTLTDGFKPASLLIPLLVNTKALLAVVELHKPYIPMDNETGDYSVLAYCNCSKAFNERDAITYPCPTIQAIEKELE